METKIIDSFYVVGISIRTTNAGGQAATDIEQLWQKFWGENIADKIPNKVSTEIYAVYTDYETDFTGPYTTIIGLPVHSLAAVPEGFTGLEIGRTTYREFTVKGKMPEAVGNSWMEIWADTALNDKRAYKADFTVHGEKYNDTDQAEVSTYISIR